MYEKKKLIITVRIKYRLNYMMRWERVHAHHSSCTCSSYVLAANNQISPNAQILWPFSDLSLNWDQFPDPQPNSLTFPRFQKFPKSGNSALNDFSQHSSSPGNRVHCYTGLAVSSPVVAETNDSTHCTYPPRDGQDDTKQYNLVAA